MLLDDLMTVSPEDEKSDSIVKPDLFGCHLYE